MKLHEKIKQIEALEAIDTPWEVRRVFGRLSVYGSSICITDNQNGDFVSLEEFQQALAWLVEQAGGTINFKKEKK